MKDSKLIDSSVWLDYFINGHHKNIIDSNEILIISVISLFEVKKKLIKIKVAPETIAKSIDFIKKRSLIIPINDDIAEKAVDISIEKNLPAIDSLIYITAIKNNATLFTLDNDFKGLKNAVLLK